MGATALAAAGLGTMWMNVTGSAILIGVISALETLVSQAHGARNYPRIGILLQRSILINTVLCIPIGFMWFFCGDILLLLKQEPNVAQLAGHYVKLDLNSILCVFSFPI